MVKLELYLHHKGDLYIAFDVGTDSNNEGRHESGQVVYYSVSTSMIRFRSTKEFFEVIEWPDGETRPRFLLIRNTDELFNRGVHAAWSKVQREYEQRAKHGMDELDLGDLLDIRDDIARLKRPG